MRNPIAKAVKKIPPKVKPSGKVYKRERAEPLVFGKPASEWDKDNLREVLWHAMPNMTDDEIDAVWRVAWWPE